jgi:hypothetical protein
LRTVTGCLALLAGNLLEQGGMIANSTANNQRKPGMPIYVREYPASRPGIIYSFSCDDFFSIFSYAYASRFYDAFSFYHKAYSQYFLCNELGYLIFFL